MKKYILLVTILIILIFSFPTKIKRKNTNSRRNIENSILITLHGNRKYDSDEDISKLSRQFHEKNTIKNKFDTPNSKNFNQHSSRHNKGKIMYYKDRYANPKTKAE
jgi:peptidoglycan hydrolase CwlO-like protein